MNAILLRCNRCGRDQPIDAFHRHAGTPQSRHQRQYYCKPCQIAAVVATRNPEKAAAYAKAHVPERSAASRKWRKANAQKMRTYAYAYYWKNREHLLRLKRDRYWSLRKPVQGGK